MLDRSRIADHRQQRNQDDGAYLHDTVAPLGHHQQGALELERDDDGKDQAEHRLEHVIIGRIEIGCPDATTAVSGEREGPSADKTPTAPSFPMTAVATVCPLGMSSMNAIVPLRGK
jgi:hypothetical protein